MSFVRIAFAIVIGSLFVALGINLFLVPFHLLDGGGIGISLIIHYVIGGHVGFIFLLISLPIFILAWFTYRSFFYNGIHGMFVSSLFIDLLHPLQQIGQHFFSNVFLNAACGGIFIGTGVGIMLLVNVSIGGTDLLAQMLAEKLQINPGWTIFSIDVFVIIVGSFIIDSVYFLYSLTTALCVSSSIWLIIQYRKNAQLQQSPHSIEMR